MKALNVTVDYAGEANPVIVEEFAAGTGWRRTGWRKRASMSWLRKLREQGVESVALEVNGRAADFTVAELIRGGSR